MASPTPCWYCRHFVSLDLSSRIAACALVGCMVRSRDGCSRFEREPGVDDDDWAPPEAMVAAWRPEQAQEQRDRGGDGWWMEPPRPRRPRTAPACTAAAFRLGERLLDVRDER
jgi:hypothetical protein